MAGGRGATRGGVRYGFWHAPLGEWKPIAQYDDGGAHPSSGGSRGGIASAGGGTASVAGGRLSGSSDYVSMELNETNSRQMTVSASLKAEIDEL